MRKQRRPACRLSPAVDRGFPRPDFLLRRLFGDTATNPITHEGINVGDEKASLIYSAKENLGFNCKAKTDSHRKLAVGGIFAFNLIRSESVAHLRPFSGRAIEQLLEFTLEDI